jgi:hypothetical protein
MTAEEKLVVVQDAINVIEARLKHTHYSENREDILIELIRVIRVLCEPNETAEALYETTIKYVGTHEDMRKNHYYPMWRRRGEEAWRF